MLPELPGSAIDLIRSFSRGFAVSCIVPPPVPTFYDRFVRCAERWPENRALELVRPDGLETYTYAELRQTAESIAGWLVKRGFPPGERIAIFADNHPRWIAAYLAIIAAGGAAVPLDTAYDSDQLAKLLADSGSSLLICDAKHLETAQRAAVKTETPVVLTASRPYGAQELATPPLADFDEIFRERRPQFTPVGRAEDDVAALLYTSGTTADPKGVMLTHANLLAEADAVFAWADIGPEDAILGVLPLFHVLSQMANLLLPLVAGTRVSFLATLNTTELLRALQEREITAFAVVPQFFYLIHERIFKEVSARGAAAVFLFRAMMRFTAACRRIHLNPGRIFFGRIHRLLGRRMRYLVTGGSRFDPQIARDYHALGIDVLEAYGLTETSGGAFVNSPGDNVIGSVGRPLKGIEGKIVDAGPAEEGVPASGEILVRGPIVMKGYWNRSDATAEVLREGWLHTGDLGYFDASGHLVVTGRKKEVIILANGKNLYPEEIEAHYRQSPFIQEICVLGLEGPAGSDKLHAVIVPHFENLRQRKVVNAKEVIRFDVEGLSAKLPSTKRITSYEIWQHQLPRTTTRKLKRQEIRKLVAEGQGSGEAAELGGHQDLSAEERTWLESSDVGRALHVIAEYAPNRRKPIHPRDNLELDLGLDSMRRVELLVALEQELGGRIEESRLTEIYTVRELIDSVLHPRTETGARERPAAGWSSILKEDPSDPRARAIIKPRPFVDRMLFVLLRGFGLFWRMLARLEVQGLENLPPNGAFLLCSNHQSYLDPIPLLAVLPYAVLERLFAVGTSEIFGEGIMRLVARLLRVVVVDPDANLVPAMRAGAFGLRQGRGLILYPEGERSIDGTPKSFKKGAAILAIHLQVPLVPVAIDGFFDAWPRGKSFQKFAPLKIKIGPAIAPPPASQASENSYQSLTGELRQQVVDLWEELRRTA